MPDNHISSNQMVLAPHYFLHYFPRPSASVVELKSVVVHLHRRSRDCNCTSSQYRNLDRFS